MTAVDTQQIVQHLQEYLIDHYKTYYSLICKQFNFSQEELKPTENKNSTNTAKIYDQHAEYRRQAKIIRIAMKLWEVYEQDLYILQVFSNLNIQPPQAQRQKGKKPSRNYKSVSPVQSKFQTVASTGFQNGQVKYDKTISVMERLKKIKSQDEQRKARKDYLMKKKLEQIQDIKRSISENHQKAIENQEKKRINAKELKQKLEATQYRDRIKHSKLIEAKKEKFIKRQKSNEKRQQDKKNQEKIERMKTQSDRFAKEMENRRKSDAFVLNQLNRLQERFQKTSRNWSTSQEQRVQRAKEHYELVENRLNSAVSNWRQEAEDKFNRIIYKSKLCKEKKLRKNDISQEIALKTHKQMQERFEKSNQILIDQNKEKQRKLKQFELKKKEKYNLRNQIKESLSQEFEEKVINNLKRKEVQLKNLQKQIDKQENKKRQILEKHNKIKQNVDMLNKTKQDVAYYKKQSSYELGQLRTSEFTSKQLRNQSIDFSSSVYSSTQNKRWTINYLIRLHRANFSSPSSRNKFKSQDNTELSNIKRTSRLLKDLMNLSKNSKIQINIDLINYETKSLMKEHEEQLKYSRISSIDIKDLSYSSVVSKHIDLRLPKDYQ